MVIRSETLKSIVIREIISYTGTQGGLSPAIHRGEPHPVRPRYQHHKTCGSHCAIVQLDNRYSPAKHSVIFCLKVYTPYLRNHTVFYLCQPSCTLLRPIAIFFFARARISAHEPTRGVPLCATFFKHRSRWARTGTSTEISGCTVILVHALDFGLARRFR